MNRKFIEIAQTLQLIFGQLFLSTFAKLVKYE
ncbi:hypothetical protein VIRA109638_09650 [Vibrio rarus]